MSYIRRSSSKTLMSWSYIAPVERAVRCISTSLSMLTEGMMMWQCDETTESRWSPVADNFVIVTFRWSSCFEKTTADIRNCTKLSRLTDFVVIGFWPAVNYGLPHHSTTSTPPERHRPYSPRSWYGQSAISRVISIWMFIWWASTDAWWRWTWLKLGSRANTGDGWWWR